MSYGLEKYQSRGGTFVDTDDEETAIATAYEEYFTDDAYLYVLSKTPDDYTSEPTHIVLYDVIYKLVEVPQPD